MNKKEYYDESKVQCQTCLHCIYEMNIRSLLCQKNNHTITEQEKWLPRHCKDYEQS